MGPGTKNPLAQLTAPQGNSLRDMVYGRYLEPASERLNALARMLGGFVPPEPRNRLAGLAEALTPRPQDIFTGSADLMRGLGSADANAALGGLSLMAMGAMDAVPGGKGARVAGDAVQGIRAYHGSPHDFDRFSMDRIGTGEGAQAYGHGLYFAEAEDVARGYRDALTRGASTGSGRGRTAVFTVDGKELPVSQRDVADIAHMMKTYGIDPKTADGADWLSREVGARGLPYEAMQEAANLARLNIDRKTVDGRMYEVNIRANPDDFLDWDKPLSQQSEAVRNAITSILPDNEVTRAWRENGVLDNAKAGSLLSVLSDKTKGAIERGNAAALSQKLREAGVPGIKYLDAGSRTAGDGSRNYVAFDDQMIEILRKYGLAGLYLGGAAGAASQFTDTENGL
jgi:hypothetical protein